MEFNSIGLDSITFIKTIFALEGEFDFNFDDEMLLITKFPTIRTMVEYGRNLRYNNKLRKRLISGYLQRLKDFIYTRLAY